MAISGLELALVPPWTPGNELRDLQSN